jgi:hypothetical protein
LVIAGFDGKHLKKQKAALFQGYDDVGSILFVNTTKEIELVGDDSPEEPTSPEVPPASEEAVREAPAPEDESPANEEPGRVDS